MTTIVPPLWEAEIPFYCCGLFGTPLLVRHGKKATDRQMCARCHTTYILIVVPPTTLVAPAPGMTGPGA